MYGSIMYEVAQQRISDQRRAAVKDGEARVSRAAARARRARNSAVEPIAMPAIPDYAHELLAATRATVPAQRQEAGRPEAGRGRHARAGR
jgi:dihydroxyacetone kinase